MSVNKKHSLRRKALTAVANQHPEIDNRIGTPRYKTWLDVIYGQLDMLNKPRWLWLIVGFVPLVVYIFTFTRFAEWTGDLPWISSISFENTKSAATLIDQRTSNIATIISMTLAVTGILLSNMAIKEPLVYHLLYQRAKLRLIITYTLTVIFVLIIIGTLKDSFDEKHSVLFYRAVITGTYLVLVIVFMIAHLFKVVYEFSDMSRIKIMLREGYMKEAVANLKSDLIRLYAEREIKKLFESSNFEPFSFAMAAMKGISKDKVTAYSNIKQEERYIYDVDLLKLETTLKLSNNPKIRLYRSVSLNAAGDKYNCMVLTDMPVNQNVILNENITRCLDLKPQIEIDLPETRFKKYYSEKLQEGFEQKKYNEVSGILEMYEDFYKIEFRQKSLIPNS